MAGSKTTATGSKTPLVLGGHGGEAQPGKVEVAQLGVVKGLPPTVQHPKPGRRSLFRS